MKNVGVAGGFYLLENVVSLGTENWNGDFGLWAIQLKRMDHERIYLYMYGTVAYFKIRSNSLSTVNLFR